MDESHHHGSFHQVKLQASEVTKTCTRVHSDCVQVSIINLSLKVFNSVCQRSLCYFVYLRASLRKAISTMITIIPPIKTIPLTFTTGRGGIVVSEKSIAGSPVSTTCCWTAVWVMVVGLMIVRRSCTLINSIREITITIMMMIAIGVPFTLRFFICGVFSLLVGIILHFRLPAARFRPHHRHHVRSIGLHFAKSDRVG